MIKKTQKLRIIFDFSITVDESVIPEHGNSPDEDHYIGYQRRLFQAVCANSEAYNQYLVYLMTGNFESMNWHDWHKMLLGHPDAELEHILPSAIERLDVTDQQWFAEAQEEKMLYEATEGFQGCFSVTLDNHTIEETMEEDEG